MKGDSLSLIVTWSISNQAIIIGYYIEIKYLAIIISGCDVDMELIFSSNEGCIVINNGNINV